MILKKDQKYHLIEGIIFTIFIFFNLNFFGIPDKYDFYIYIFLGIVLVVLLGFYLKIVLKELEEI